MSLNQNFEKIRSLVLFANKKGKSSDCSPNGLSRYMNLKVCRLVDRVDGQIFVYDVFLYSFVLWLCTD